MSRRVDVRTSALSTLQRLHALSKSDPTKLSLRKADLAKLAGVSMAQLYVHLSLLAKHGLAILHTPEARMAASRVEVTAEGEQAAFIGTAWFSGVREVTTDVSGIHPECKADTSGGDENSPLPLSPLHNPPYTPVPPCTNQDRVGLLRNPPPSASLRDASARPDHDQAAEEAVVIPLPVRKPTVKRLPPALAAKKVAPPPVEPGEPVPVEVAPKEESVKVAGREVTTLDVPGMGRMTTTQIWSKALRGELSPEAMSKLVKAKTGAMKPWHKAAIKGLVTRLQRQYIARWAKATGAPQSQYRMPPKAEHYWTQAADNTLKLGVTVERFLDVAWNTKHKSVRAPTVQQLAGPALFSTIQAGGDGVEDTTGIEKGQDGMTFDELLERSIEAGVWPRDMDSYRSSVSAK